VVLKFPIHCRLYAEFRLDLCLECKPKLFRSRRLRGHGSPLSSLGSPAESITITDTSDQKLNEYDFPDSTTQSGQYVLMQFVDSAAAASSSSEGNPGAQEFALGIDSTVPEPASLSAGAITLGLLGLRRRRRV
jgi:hypothetical protein